MRAAGIRTLTAVASVLLALAVVAGVANREVLDGSRFAAHADAVRSDPQVSQLVGVAISDRVIALDENLVALRPAVEAVVVQLVKSSVFTPVVETAARQLHDSMTHRGSGQIVLRVADLGAVLVAALKTFAPDLAEHLPPTLDVRLADIGAQSYAGGTLRLTRLVGLLAWLLPLLGLACLVTALGLSRRRQRALAAGGLAVVAAAALVAVAYAIASALVSSTTGDTLRAALIRASWAELAPAVWRAAALVAVVGLVLFAAAGAYLPQWSVAAIEARVLGWVRAPGGGSARQLLTGAVLVVLGAAALYRPLATARAVVELIALAVVADGVGRIARVSAEHKAATTEEALDLRPDRRRRPAAAVAVLALAALLAMLVVGSWPADRAVPVVAAAEPAGDPNACNGHLALCARRYDQVAYPATHNSMSAADEPGWFIAEQPTGLIGQLDAGIRTLLVDSWYGRHTDRPGVIANAGPTGADALRQAEAEYGAAVVRSALRLRSALNLAPKGPVEPYLCHQLCPLGSTPMLAALQAVHQWLAAHPREVVTFVVEDHISAADTAKVFGQAGLLPYLHTQQRGLPWPTLGEMIRTGHRLQVFDQSNPGGPADPWLLKAWDWIQDTPYDNASQAALTCDRLRGSASHPLFLINNLITRFDTRVSDSLRLNAYDALWSYASRCRQERGRIPNYLAVDYFDKGSVFAVVDRLNGLG